MGISVLGGTASDNWVQIAATNPAASTLNFTGISGYKKLMVYYQGSGGSPTRTLSSLRLNSDSGSKYSYSGTHVSATSPYPITEDVPPALALTTTAVPSNGTYLKFIINSADNSGLKTIEYFQGGASTQAYSGTGFYMASASISSINLAWSASFSETVYLYGVLA